MFKSLLSRTSTSTAIRTRRGLGAVLSAVPTSQCRAAPVLASRSYWSPPANQHPVKAFVGKHPHSQHLPNSYMMASNVVAERAAGSWVWGRDGRKYLDFQSGIGVLSLGHCHPNVVRETTKQIQTIIHAQMNCIQHEPMLRLVEKLSKHTTKVFGNTARGQIQYHFSNSGAEAVENAVKLARQATGKPNVIVFQGGFHGRTLGSGALTTAKTFYRQSNSPLPAGVYVAPYPYCLHCPVACACAGTSKTFDRTNCCGNPIAQIKAVLKQQTAPSETAAILIEPVLGEGGYVVPPASFFKELRALCDENGLMLIVDEVQSGFGRTGKMFSIEHWEGAEPDIMIMAKGIASGFPLSAIAAPESIMSRTHAGSMGGTYGGNAVACAAANAVLDTFESENILSNVNARSKQFITAANGLKAKYPNLIADIRGLGLMLAIEFNTSGPYKTGVAGQVQAACGRNGMLILTTGIYDTLRFIPALNITESEMKTAIEILDKSFGEVAAAAKK